MIYWIKLPGKDVYLNSASIGGVRDEDINNCIIWEAGSENSVFWGINMSALEFMNYFNSELKKQQINQKIDDTLKQ